MKPMTLNQALALIRANTGAGPRRSTFLVCGCQPLHLGTFLRAFAAQAQPENEAALLTGLYGDVRGNLVRAGASGATSAAVVIEWNDVDSRLGLRAAAGWGKAVRKDIADSAREWFAQVVAAVRNLAGRMPVAVAGPTLPLPPLDNTIQAQAGSLELDLRSQAAAFLLELAGIPGVRVVQSGGEAGNGLDAKMELLAGFPYTIPQAAALAQKLAAVLWQAPPKKALITDLDDTLWAGIVGEIGADAVSWSQEHHSQAHGLYQQMLGNLAEWGVLLGVVSKNEQAVAEAALARKDLLCDARTLFPVLAGWGAKSKSVAEALRIWNIGADSVVFVDDNPMELSEVELAFPGITCLPFCGTDAVRTWELLRRLRDLFGKTGLSDEDALRRESIRAAAIIRDLGEEASSEAFLHSLQAKVTLNFATPATDKRALELVNKTNQFNLNGQRFIDAEWQRLLEQPDTFAVTVSYEDKFGPLGKIAVMLAQRPADQQSPLRVLQWVMSCRAFSRHIEQHTLDSLLRHTGAEEIEFCFTPTERNQPLQEFMGKIGARESGRIRATQFRAACGNLPHQVFEVLE